MDYLERRNDRFVFFVFRPRWSARAHRITLQQVHIVSSLSSSMHCCIALHCNPLFRWSAGYKKTSFSRCLEIQTLDIEKLFRGSRSGPTNGYLSAYLMHPVMHGGPDGTLLMINLRCAPHHHTVGWSSYMMHGMAHYIDNQVRVAPSSSFLANLYKKFNCIRPSISTSKNPNIKLFIWFPSYL